MGNNRKASECPEELREIIHWINEWLPPEGDELESLRRHFLRAATDRSLKRRPEEEINRQTRKRLGNAQLAEYLGGDPFWIVAAFNRFEDLISARPILEAICETNAFEAERYGNKAFPNKHLLSSLRRNWFWDIAFRMKIKLAGGYLIDDAGNIGIDLGGIAKIFVNHRVPFDRIRRCPICSKIYWAKKTTARTCGKHVCAAGWYQKVLLSDDRIREERNERRRTAYRSKRELEEGKKRNGSV